MKPIIHISGLGLSFEQDGRRTDVLRALDLDIAEMSPAELATKLKVEHDRWGPIVKASGARAD